MNYLGPDKFKVLNEDFYCLADVPFLTLSLPLFSVLYLWYSRMLRLNGFIGLFTLKMSVQATGWDENK